VKKISLDVASLELKKWFDVRFIKFKINQILMDKLASNVKQHPSYILGQTEQNMLNMLELTEQL
jgi:hypothetical protein